MKGILMNAFSVDGLINKRKTNTRRVIKGLGNIPHYNRLLGSWGLSKSPVYYDDAKKSGMLDEYYPWRPTRKPESGDWLWTLQTDVDDTACAVFKCTYGKPGDILYCKETYMPETENGVLTGGYIYRATAINPQPDGNIKLRWESSIFMPRKAARFYLEITDISVERVQEISTIDIRCEGVTIKNQIEQYAENYKDAFQALWDSINAKPKRAKRNPAGLKEDCYVSYPWADICETREHRGLNWYVIGNPFVWRIAFSDISETYPCP